MRKSTFNIIFYLRKDRVNKDGEVPIMIRITLNGQISQFFSKLSVNPTLWQTKGGYAIGRSRPAVQLNNALDNIKASIKNRYRTLEEKETFVSAEKLRNAFLGFDECSDTILKLFAKHNEDVSKLVGITKTKATYQKYEVTRKHIENFIRSKYNRSDLSIKEINHQFISDFEVYMLTTGGCGQNTTAKFLQFFKRIIIIARNNGQIIGDPFASYKIKLKKVDRGYLTDQELELLMNKTFSMPRLEHVRDVFVFSCFCGLAYIDVKNLTRNNIKISFDGKVWIMTHRQKTGTPVNVPLLKIPQMILDKYKGTLATDKILPILTNQKMNSYLKEIGDLCGIEKNLTFHLARHTFATTTTLSKGVPIETVSKMLGHTNIQTTQIYARITNDKISRDMAELSGKLDEIEKAANH